MALKPGQYGYAPYDSHAPKKDDEAAEKRVYNPGQYVLWKSKGIVGTVIADWKDYGVQIEHLDAKGKWVRSLVPKRDAEKSSLLDAIARA